MLPESPTDKKARANVDAVKRKAPARGNSVEKLATFIFGVTFLGVMLGVAFLLPNPTDAQSFIFRVVMAAAAGGAVIFLPGAISVDIKPTLRATGALGVFALVYAVNPPKTSPPVMPAAGKFNLSLVLTFDGDVLPLDPFDANVTAIVNNDIKFSDYPSNADPKFRSNLVQRGSGIVVGFADLADGDKVSVRLDQGGRSWRSNEMRMPAGELKMKEIRASPLTPGGQR